MAARLKKSLAHRVSPKASIRRTTMATKELSAGPTSVRRSMRCCHSWTRTQLTRLALTPPSRIHSNLSIRFFPTRSANSSRSRAAEERPNRDSDHSIKRGHETLMSRDLVSFSGSPQADVLERVFLQPRLASTRRIYWEGGDRTA